MLGLLRLLTHSKVMRGTPFTPAEAWPGYRAFRALPEVGFLPENSRMEPQFAAWSDTPTFTPHRWTDAWLAAQAVTTGSRLVTFDADFRIIFSRTLLAPPEHGLLTGPPSLGFSSRPARRFPFGRDWVVRRCSWFLRFAVRPPLDKPMPSFRHRDHAPEPMDLGEIKARP